MVVITLQHFIPAGPPQPSDETFPQELSGKLLPSIAACGFSLFPSLRCIDSFFLTLGDSLHKLKIKEYQLITSVLHRVFLKYAKHNLLVW